MTSRRIVRADAGRSVAALLLMAAIPVGATAADHRLADAAEQRSRATVTALLPLPQADVNAPQPDGATALHWAAHWNDLEMAGALVRAGANANPANDYGVTPLMLACANGSADMVRLLLAAGANPRAATLAGEPVLMTAARTGNVDVVNQLLVNGAPASVAESYRHQTALMWASAEGHLDVVRTLLDHGADLHARTTHLERGPEPWMSRPQRPMGGFTALMFAARRGNIDLVRLLLARGADVNEKPADDGSTPLLVATVRGHAALTEFLLEQGADPNNPEAGYTPLHWVAGTWESILTIDYQTESGEWSAIAGVSTREQQQALAKALIAHGANVNARVTNDPPRFGTSLFTKRNAILGATPFYLAALSGNAAMIRLLAAAGADTHAAANDGSLPLTVAAGWARQDGESRIPERDHLEAVNVLFQLGAEINAANEDGYTALHSAAHAGFPDVARFLLDKGANINAETKKGKTPLRIADIDNQTGMVLADREKVAAVLKELGGTQSLAPPEVPNSAAQRRVNEPQVPTDPDVQKANEAGVPKRER